MQNEMLEQALKYQALRFSVVPVSQEKIPLIPWKQYQNERPTPDQIRAWFKQYPVMNIGVMTGAISGVVVIDVEKGGSIEGLPVTATVRTGGGGYHLYYKHPGKPIKNSVKKIAPLTDIRADGGMCVLPPSIHASGKAYEWTIPPEAGFTELPPELLTKITSSTPTPDQESNENGDVLEGARNDTATKYIGRVLRHLPLDLWGTAGWASLKEWNTSHAKPPLTEAELRNILESIGKLERERRGGKDTSTAGPVSFQPFTLADLYKENFPPGHWAVQDLIPLGAITALTGDSNSYKTFLTQSMAASVVSGEPFVGHFPTTKGKVLIIDEENHRRQVQDRFKQLGILPTSDILFLSSAGVKIDNEEHLESLRALLEKEKPTLVILDSLVRLHSGEENSATEMSIAFEAMKKLVAPDRAVVFIHHHRKQGPGRKSNNQNIRGSSDILAAVDSHLAVDRKDSEMVLDQTKMRLQPEIDPFKVALRLTPEGNMSFTYQGVDTSEDDRLVEAYDSIKDALAESPEPMTVEALVDETLMPQARVRTAIKDLVRSKDIVLKSTGAHGVHFYGLPSPTEALDGQPAESLLNNQIN